MNSPWKTPQDEVAPIRRLLGHGVKIALALFVVVMIVGYIEVRFGTNQDATPAVLSRLAPVTAARASTPFRAHVRGDAATDGAMALVLESPVVVQARIGEEVVLYELCEIELKNEASPAPGRGTRLPAKVLAVRLSE